LRGVTGQVVNLEGGLLLTTGCIVRKNKPGSEKGRRRDWEDQILKGLSAVARGRTVFCCSSFEGNATFSHIGASNGPRGLKKEKVPHRVAGQRGFRILG